MAAVLETIAFGDINVGNYQIMGLFFKITAGCDCSGMAKKRMSIYETAKVLIPMDSRILPARTSSFNYILQFAFKP